MDIVLIVDQRCTSEDFLNFARVVSSCDDLLSSIECVPLDERSSLAWSAVRQTSMLTRYVSTGDEAKTDGNFTAQLEKALTEGHSDFIILSALNGVDMARLLASGAVLAGLNSTTLGKFPLRQGCGLSLMFPRHQNSHNYDIDDVLDADQALHHIASKLLGFALPEMTRVWVVDQVEVPDNYGSLETLPELTV